MHAFDPNRPVGRLRTLAAAGDPFGAPLLSARLTAIQALCVAEAPDPLQADDIDQFDPDLIVYEVCPCGEGLDGFLDTLESARHEVPLLVLGILPERILSILRARRGSRAWGYVDRHASPAQIEAAAQAVRLGLLVVQGDPCPESGDDRTPLADPDTEPLTGRESQILHLLAEGLPNKGIAARLSISAHTVKFHVARILDKLGAESRAEAVAAGVRQGHLRL